MRQLYLGAATAFAAAVLFCTPHTAAAQRPGPGPCREAVNGLVSLLDGKMDDTAFYRDSFKVVVNTCGPVKAMKAQSAAPPPSGRAACHDLAVALTDLIEDDKMDTADFVKVRTAFSQFSSSRDCARRV